VNGKSNRDPKLVAKVRDQADRITEAFASDKVTVVTVYDADGGISFMYAEGHILVRDKFLEGVQAILGQPAGLGHVTQVIEDVVLLTLVKATGRKERVRVPIGKQPTVIAAVQAVDDEFGEGVATPDHVLTVAPSGPCPATEPQEIYDQTEPFPGICTENSGEGVLVYVADTGLLKDHASEHPWLAGVRRAHLPDGSIQPWEPELKPDPLDGVMRIPPYTGHGTFVAGVVRCMAPKAEVIVANIFKVAGSSLESHFVRQLRHALRLGVDIFNLSVAAPTRHTHPLMAFERWLRLLHQHKGVVCIVAAGNDGNKLPTWPSAFPKMVSVGALAANWRDRADFSNYGGWVDVYTPGRDLINAYATGEYRCQDAPYTNQRREFYGMAKWSGTSFSTPVMTGLVAARMWRTGESGQEAAAALLSEARSQAIPGVGAVLLPCGGRGGTGAPCPVECGCGHAHERQTC
jgi:subtilisin family serine protease